MSFNFLTEQSRRHVGFTLVEMAVVLILIGIVMSMGLAVGTSALQSAQRNTTQERQAYVREALINYFITNHHMPCPDTGSTVGGRDGTENRVGGPGTRCSAAIGTVPYITLGIARNYALDAYGNFITYRLDTALASGRAWHLPRLPAPCVVPAAGLSVFSAPAAVPLRPVVFVLISHGANGQGAWSQGPTNASRNALPPAGSPEFGNTQQTPAAPAGYRAYAFSDVPATAFDDMVTQLTVSELKIFMENKLLRSNICN